MASNTEEQVLLDLFNRRRSEVQYSEAMVFARAFMYFRGDSLASVGLQAVRLIEAVESVTEKGRYPWTLSGDTYDCVWVEVFRGAFYGDDTSTQKTCTDRLYLGGPDNLPQLIRTAIGGHVRPTQLQLFRKFVANAPVDAKKEIVEVFAHAYLRTIDLISLRRLFA